MMDCRLRRLPSRLFEKIVIDSGSGCWVWVGASQSNGYGRAWDGNKSTYAHRVIYEQISGPIDAGLDLDHLCRNRICVNPDHLEPVTRSENLKRGDSGENLASKARAMTHCHRGHKFTEENTHRHNGRRICRACGRIRYHEKRSTSNV